MSLPVSAGHHVSQYLRLRTPGVLSRHLAESGDAREAISQSEHHNSLYDCARLMYTCLLKDPCCTEIACVTLVCLDPEMAARQILGMIL